MNDVTHDEIEGTYIEIPYASPIVCLDQVEVEPCPIVAWYSGLDMCPTKTLTPLPTFTSRAVASVDRDFQTSGRMSIVEVTLSVFQRDDCDEARVYVTMGGDASVHEYIYIYSRGRLQYLYCRRHEP